MSTTGISNNPYSYDRSTVPSALLPLVAWGVTGVSQAASPKHADIARTVTQVFFILSTSKSAKSEADDYAHEDLLTMMSITKCAAQAYFA
jgi:hypothetical protein